MARGGINKPMRIRAGRHGHRWWELDINLQTVRSIRRSWPFARNKHHHLEHHLVPRGWRPVGPREQRVFRAAVRHSRKIGISRGAVPP